MTNLRENIALSLPAFFDPSVKQKDVADAILAKIKASVPNLVWEDYPSNQDGPVLSMAVTMHGTYFICDDTDDFTGLYLRLISHDNAKWWRHVRSTSVTIMDHIHTDDLSDVKAVANTHHVAQLTDWMMK